jgi:hypothetical protein
VRFALEVALEYIKNGNEVAMRSGYAATWAAPGTGKTHLLDAVVLSMQASDDYRFFVPLPVTFNGNMNEIELGVLGLVARVLYVYFVGMLRNRQFAEVFSKVVDLVKSIGRLELLQLLEAVAHDFATARGVDAASVMPVLLLDEIRLSGDVRRVYDAATESLANYRTIITSLDPETVRPVMAMTTSAASTSTPVFAMRASNKPITWLPLPRLHTDDCRERPPVGAVDSNVRWASALNRICAR